MFSFDSTAPHAMRAPGEDIGMTAHNRGHLEIMVTAVIGRAGAPAT